MRRGGLEAPEACLDRALQERHKSRAQAADAELKSRDAAKSISEMEASVSSEKGLRLAAGAVNMKAEDERLHAKLAMRAARQHRAWKERWPCHVDGAVYSYIVSLYIASYVAFLCTGIVCSSSSRYQVQEYALEPESRARVEPEPSSLDSEMDDTLSLAEIPREPEHPSESLGCRAFTGTYSRGILGPYIGAI